MGQLHPIRPAAAGPGSTFAHGVEPFLSTHTTSGAWAPGTEVKYRQTLSALAARLADRAGPLGISSRSRWSA